VVLCMVPQVAAGREGGAVYTLRDNGYTREVGRRGGVERHALVNTRKQDGGRSTSIYSCDVAHRGLLKTVMLAQRGK
jgi:hypothetical protein